MATFINERRMVDDTLFNYEKKFHSPMSRFIDKTQTYTTYFHIADEATTVEDGFMDVYDFIGTISPFRFKRINGFPIYGLDQVVLALEDTDQGLDRSYEGEATIINSTITPTQNDFFMIPSLHDFFIFRVVSVNSDHIMDDNYYQIGFCLECVDREKTTFLNKQTIEEYECVTENIGTEQKCLIRSDIYGKVKKIEAMYADLAETYRSIFYSERYNCFLGEINGPCQLLYDPLQVEFILKHDLFNQKNQLNVVIPTMHFTDSKRTLKYERSIYRFFERRDLRILSPFKFTIFPGIDNSETGFSMYHDKTVFISNIQTCSSDAPSMQIFSDEFVEAMRVNGPVETRYGKILIEYIWNNDMSIDNVPDDLIEELLQLSAVMEIFFIIPIILYILKQLISRALEKPKDLTTVEI